MNTISEAQETEVLTMIALKFSDRYIAERVGISRTTVADIRSGRRKIKQQRKRADELQRARTPEQIRRDAQQALIECGRQSVKLLDYNPNWS